jgi:hypothetical protein
MHKLCSVAIQGSFTDTLQRNIFKDTQYVKSFASQYKYGLFETDQVSGKSLCLNGVAYQTCVEMNMTDKSEYSATLKTRLIPDTSLTSWGQWAPLDQGKFYILPTESTLSCILEKIHADTTKINAFSFSTNGSVTGIEGQIFCREASSIFKVSSTEIAPGVALKLPRLILSIPAEDVKSCNGLSFYNPPLYHNSTSNGASSISNLHTHILIELFKSLSILATLAYGNESIPILVTLPQEFVLHNLKDMCFTNTTQINHMAFETIKFI